MCDLELLSSILRDLSRDREISSLGAVEPGESEVRFDFAPFDPRLNRQLEEKISAVVWISDDDAVQELHFLLHPVLDSRRVGADAERELDRALRLSARPAAKFYLSSDGALGLAVDLFLPAGTAPEALAQLVRLTLRRIQATHTRWAMVRWGESLQAFLTKEEAERLIEERHLVASALLEPSVEGEVAAAMPAPAKTLVM